MLCHGLGIHLWVNAQFAKLDIHYELDISECQHKICKYMSFLKNFWQLIFIFISEDCQETKEKKGYVKLITILTCVIWDWHVVQNVSTISLGIIEKIRLMEWWHSMYVTFMEKIIEA